MNDIKVRTRLAVGFGLVIMLMILSIALGLMNMKQIQSHLNEIANVNNVESKLLATMQASLYDRLVAARNVALLTEMADMKQEVERIVKQTERYAAAEKKLSGMFESLAGTTPEEKALLKKIREAEVAAMPLFAKATDLGLANKNEEATKVLIKELRPLQKIWQNALTELADLEEKLNDTAATDAAKAYASATSLLITIGVIAVLVALAAAIIITRSLGKQLGGEPGYAAAVASRIAAGDLSGHIELRTHDSSSLLFAMKTMRDNLVNIVSKVRTGTDAIATGSSQIAVGNQDLSSRTEEQASSLEETASSMEELTSTVRQNADNATQANKLAVSASTVAVKGGEVIAQVVDTMSSINESAKKIVDIIGVIDGIAFQTNILALNAAVEAARAGEQGRGFAVVASEVRNLAQRSAAAAKEIKTLIGDSVQKVDVGSKLVGEAGATMEEIVDSVKRVTDIMAEIMAASQEQSAGIEQVNQAIGQMDQVTQQNAALVEEAASAAESLKDQASNLSQTVAVFKLDNMHSGTVSSSVAARPPAVVKIGTAPRTAKGSAVAHAPARKQLAPSAAGEGEEWESF